MKILGIHANTHDTGCALMVDGRLIHVASQERFDRHKMSQAPPIEAIDEALETTGIKASEIDYLAISDDLSAQTYSYRGSNHKKRMLDETLRAALGYFWYRPWRFWKYYKGHRFSKGIRRGQARADRVEAARKHLLDKGFRGRQKTYEHGYCHATSAYYCSGFDRSCKCLVFVNEGGSFINSASVYVGHSGQVRKILDIPTTHSPGVFYATATRLLGFNPGRHEGKITGLAAMGDPKVLGDLGRELFRLEDGRDDYYLSPLVYLWWRDYRKMRPGRPLPRPLRGHSREDIAAAWQIALEEGVAALIERYLRRYPDVHHVALSGGVHGNVKLNQRINELVQIQEIYVHPGMGDCGQPVGAALACWAETDDQPAPFRQETAYLGCGVDGEEVRNLTREYELVFEQTDDLAEAVADLLAQKKVVGICRGAMEYGPRALGNRSILYTPTDPAVNDWLNHQLRRTEFMPFAPVTLIESIDECYINGGKSAYTAGFMTVCYDCTDHMKRTQPAVVHVDGTARPQYIARRQNPFYYDVVENFRRRTGIPSVVNTSFNMHEEPIVRTAGDALRAFVASNLDALVLEDKLLLRDKNQVLRQKMAVFEEEDERSISHEI